MELDNRQAAAMESDQDLVLQTGGPPHLPPYDVAIMPGFRFQPTEEELVGFYIRSMVMGDCLEVDLINVLNLYRYDPWELPAMAFMQGEREWLFFCPRDKKYPNGTRPNRVTASGYWKVTGTDRPVRRAYDARCIGLKKTLVFYRGKAPRGRKTEWIMNEYRLPQNEQNSTFCQTLHNVHLKSTATTTTTTELGRREVALCRIYKKPFQINLISATVNLLADNFMPDVDPSGSSTPQSEPPSPKGMKLAPLNGLIMNMEMDTGISTSSNGFRNNIAKLEADLSSNLLHYKYPGIPAAPAGEYLSAHLMEAEAAHHVFRKSSSPAVVPNFGGGFCVSANHVFMHRNAGAERSSTHQVVNRLNWSDCFAGETQSVSTENQLQQPGDQCPTIASIDRLLKASMWSPLPPLNLDYAGTLKLDCGDGIHELDGSTSAVLPPTINESCQFVFPNSLPS